MANGPLPDSWRHGIVDYQAPPLGSIETAIHWLTDFAKCEDWIGMHQDQDIRVCCKIGYTFLM